jgi:tellurite resistance protein TehA-like permease
MQDNSLQKRIMRRVYRIYLMKSVAQPLLFELALMAAFLGISTFYISLKSVLENTYAQDSMLDMGEYFFSAFMNTRVIVQTIAVGAFVALVVFIGDSVRRIRRAVQYGTQ